LTELKNEPSLSSGMVEELLRYHTASAMTTRRLATADITVAGQVDKFQQQEASKRLLQSQA
jgi:nitric oxide reductase